MRLSAAIPLVCAVWAAPAPAQALPCAHDDALARAAAALLEEGDALSPGSIARAARRAGADLPAVHALHDVALADGRVRDWLARLSTRSDAPLVCGDAQGEGGRVVLAAARGGSLEIDEGAGTLRVRGRLHATFDRPELMVRAADGVPRRLGLDRDDLAEGIGLPEDLPLPVVVQLVAHGPRGPRPVAERIAGGRAGPAVVTGAGSLDARLEALRQAHGAAPVRPNRLLAGEASAHAARVCRTGTVAHTLAPGEDPERRLRRRGIEARLVGEVVARAASQEAALGALLDSPSHQYTLVDRRFTDGGLGTATDETGHACVVVLLAAWPRYVGR